MATISAAGIGSGLDIESLISSLMSVEQIPLQSLQLKAGGLLTQISAYGTLRSALANFQDAVSGLAATDNFNLYTATSGNTDVYTATADSTATVGAYDITVDNLAVAHKQGSTASIADTSTIIGSAGDQMTITIGSNSFTVDYGGETLATIQGLINDATDNVGVTAGIVQESATSVHLVLSSDNTGTDYAMSLAFADSGGGAISDPFTMSQIQAAENSQITIDSTYTITRSSNTVSDAIEGVSIDLLAENATAAQLTVARNDNAISSAVSDLVESYNSLMTSISRLRSSELNGDGTLRLVELQIDDLLGGGIDVSGAYTYASQVGVTFEKDGTLSYDGAELSAALADDRDAVVDFFTNADNGFGVQLDALLESMLDTSGLIDAREDGLNARLDNTNDEIDRMEYRLEVTERRYRAQYSALDTLLGQLQSTSDWLTGQFAILNTLLPGARNSNNGI
jgi:flagellar hook-associated protein 2